MNTSGHGFPINGMGYSPTNGLPLHTPGGMATAGVLHQSHIIESQAGDAATGTFTCPHCGKSYDRKSRWESHVNTHLNVRLYTCDNSCGATSWCVHKLVLESFWRAETGSL